MKHSALFALVFLIPSTACSRADTNISQEYFSKVCDWEEDTSLECEALHDKNIKLAGTLYYPGNRMTATLFPIGTQVPNNENDPRWDELPHDSEEFTLMLAETDAFSKLHQKVVNVTGKIDTSCATKSRTLQEETNAINDAKEEDDEFIISMLTGFCHSHSIYIKDLHITEIKQ